MNPHIEKIIKDAKSSLKEYKLGELEAWRKHVINNPYKGGDSDINEHIVKILDEEIAKRKKNKICQ